MPERSYHHGDLRVALLKAGEAELAERGAEQFSLRGVAKRAGVSHAAPAHHFGGKAGLLTALAQQGFEAFAERIESASGGSPLVAAGLAYVEFALSHPKLFALMFGSSWPDFDADELDRSSARAFDAFISHVQVAHGASGLSSDDLHVRAMASWSAVHGLAQLLLEGRMRSVLALPESARRPMLRKILEVAALEDRLGGASLSSDTDSR